METSPRIVFLIDERVPINRKSQTVHNICLGCLRVLTYFANQRSQGKSSLLWGYKFFDSAASRTDLLYRSGSFLDYKTQDFEEFENILFEKLSAEQDVSESVSHCPGYNLKIALTQVQSDFPWDRPELFSPTKKLSDARSSTKLNTANYVFLFMACPETSGLGQYSFFQSNINSESELLNQLMPLTLHDKFIVQSRISLVWVDVRCGFQAIEVSFFRR